MLLFSRNNSAAESPAVSWLPGAEISLRGSLAPVEPSSVFGLRSGETKCPEGGCQGGRHSLESGVAGKTAGPSFGIWQCPSGATSILTLLCCPTCNRNLRTSAFFGTSSKPCVVSVCMCVVCYPFLLSSCGVVQLGTAGFGNASHLHHCQISCRLLLADSCREHC